MPSCSQSIFETKYDSRTVDSHLHMRLKFVCAEGGENHALTRYSGVVNGAILRHHGAWIGFVLEYIYLCIDFMYTTIFVLRDVVNLNNGV